MKKCALIVSLLAMMLFSISTAFAASEDVTIMDENYDLSSIKTLAVATPLYSPSALDLERQAKLADAPELITTDMLVQAIADTAQKDKVPFKILTDKEVNALMLSSTGTDITTLDKVAAKKFYKANIKNYADAYVVFTFVEDKRVVMFADIYDAKDNHYLYSYRIIGNGVEDDNMENYNMFFHKFFRTLRIQSEK